VAKIQKKNKNALLRFGVANSTLGSANSALGSGGAAKFLCARILALKRRMTSHVGIPFCKIPLLRVSPYSENLCFVISCHTGLPQYYAR
jgi:hypothetical protein